MNTAARIISLPTPNIAEPNNKADACIVTSIEQDIRHPLNHNLVLLLQLPLVQSTEGHKGKPDP